MTSLPAELAYLFRHALLRDAAYALQPPSTRAELHAHACEVIDALTAGNPTLRAEAALELADHALLAAQTGPGWPARELTYLELASRHAAERYRDEDAARLCRRIESHAAATPAQRCRALYRLGAALERMARQNDAVACFETARQVAHDAGDEAFATEVSLRLAALYVPRGRLAESLEISRAAIDLYTRVGDDDGRAGALGVYAFMCFVKGDPAEAEARQRESMALHAARGNIAGRNTGARHLMFWLAKSRRMAEAEALAHELLELARNHEGPDRVAGALLDYSMALTTIGDWSRAADLARQSWEGFRAVGNRHDALRALTHLAGCLRMKGDFEQAESLLLQSLQLLHEVDAPSLKVGALANLAGLYKRSGRLKQAEDCYAQVMESQRKVGDVRMLGHNGGNYAELLHMQGRLEEAEKAFQEALQHLATGVDQHVQAVHRGRYAVLLVDMGRTEEAAPLYRQCIEALQAHGDNNELKKAREAMANVCTKHGQPVPD